MKLTPLKLDKKQRQGGRGCLTHIEDIPYLNLCICILELKQGRGLHAEYFIL